MHTDSDTPDYRLPSLTIPHLTPGLHNGVLLTTPELEDAGVSVERIRGEIHLAGYFNCHPEINRQSRAIVLISSLCVVMNHFALGDPQPRHPGQNAVTLKPFQPVDLYTVQTALIACSHKPTSTFGFHKVSSISTSSVISSRGPVASEAQLGWVESISSRLSYNK